MSHSRRADSGVSGAVLFLPMSMRASRSGRWVASSSSSEWSMAATSSGAGPPVGSSLATHTSVVSPVVSGSRAATNRAGATGLSHSPVGASTAVTLPSGSPSVACPASPAVPSAAPSTPSTVKGKVAAIGTTTRLAPAAMWFTPLIGGVGAGPTKVRSTVCCDPNVSRMAAPGPLGVTCPSITSASNSSTTMSSWSALRTSRRAVVGAPSAPRPPCRPPVVPTVTSVRRTGIKVRSGR